MTTTFIAFFIAIVGLIVFKDTPVKDVMNAGLMVYLVFMPTALILWQLDRIHTTIKNSK